LTKAELIAEISKRAGISKAVAEKALNATLDAIKNAISSGSGITLVGFGSFRVQQKNARTGRNPRTGQKMTIPARRVVRFTPGKELREAV